MDFSFNSLKGAWTDVSGALSEAGDAFKSLVMDDFSQPMPAASPYKPSVHNYNASQQVPKKVPQTSETTGIQQPGLAPIGNDMMQQNRQPSGQNQSQYVPNNPLLGGSLTTGNIRPNGGIQNTQQSLKQQNLQQMQHDEQKSQSKNNQNGQTVYEPYYAPSPSIPSVSDQIRAALAQSAAKKTEEQQSNGTSSNVTCQTMPTQLVTSTNRLENNQIASQSGLQTNQDRYSTLQNSQEKDVSGHSLQRQQEHELNRLPQYHKPTPFVAQLGQNAVHALQSDHGLRSTTTSSRVLKPLPNYYKPTPFAVQKIQNTMQAQQRNHYQESPAASTVETKSLPQYYKPTPLITQPGTSTTSGVLSQNVHSGTYTIAAPEEGILNHYPQMTLPLRSKSTTDLNRTKSVPDLQRTNSSSDVHDARSSFHKPTPHKPVKTRSSWHDLNMHKSTPDLRRSGVSPGPGYESPGAVMLSRKNSLGSNPRAWRSLSRGPTPSQERERIESEKAEIQKQLEAEIRELKSSLNQIHTAEDKVERKDKPREDLLHSLKKDLDQLRSENRSLRSNLTEAQTNLVLSRSELVTLKSDYEEQNGFISNNRDVLQDYMGERENLTKQLHLLHEANKKLQDTNDDLRAALENVTRQSSRMSPRTTRLLSSASFMNDYMDDDGIPDPTRQRQSFASQGSYDGSEVAMNAGGRRRFAYHTTDGDNYPDDGAFIQHSGARKLLEEYLDSGNSTLRDPNELDSETEEDLRRAPPLREELAISMKQEMKDAQRHASTSSQHSTNSKRVSSMGLQTSHHGEPIRDTRPLSRSGSPRSSSGGSRKRNLPQLPQKPLSPTPTAHPERMYKVVLAGDAAVGKSSFIMRLCKGIFHSNLNSTLGVDFQMKTIDVDDRVTSLQLWDTAGQERFRSIAKSYFRRADGVLLLYDCTSERSFINVRDWIEAIEESSHKPVPVMICANKVDARPQAIAEGVRCVRTEDGQRLATSFNALFIETSAKEGNHVEDAVIELTRQLHKREDLEVSSSGITLDTNAPGKKKDSGCCDF